MTISERFWSKVEKGDGCWLWLAATCEKGYGKFQPTHARDVRAHRFAWEDSFGPIPTGLFVLHSCDNPPCVRPDHLHLGTALQNSREMVERCRQTRGERNPGAILRSSDVEAIRSLRAAGHACVSIATRFGVSLSNIYAITNGKSWTATPPRRLATLGPSPASTTPPRVSDRASGGGPNQDVQ